jgi:hypothetical protein
MGRRGAQVDAAYWCAVTKIGEDWTEKELLGEPGTAAAEVAANQVLIHGFKIGR